MTMRKLLPALALTGLLGFTACTDAYGRYDPVATGFLAAGAAVAAVAVGVAASQPSRAGQPSQRGRRGEAHAYNLARVRLEEKRRVEQAEIAYRRLTEGWTRRGRRAPTGAAKEERP